MIKIKSDRIISKYSVLLVSCYKINNIKKNIRERYILNILLFLFYDKINEMIERISNRDIY